MSHVHALDRAMTDAERSVIEIIDFNTRPKLFNQQENKIDFNLLGGLRPKAVFLSIRGNYHNVLGLIESPIPMSIGDRDRGAVPGAVDSKTRHFVPQSLMRAYMASILEDQSFSHFGKLAAHFSEAQIFHLSPPPPCGDAAHVSAHPGIFRPRLHLGVSPPSLRRKFFDIQTDLYREACERANITFVDVPKGATGEDGLMKRDYWNNDPTHGNAAYGRLVLNQINALTGEFA